MLSTRGSVSPNPMRKDPTPATHKQLASLTVFLLQAGFILAMVGAASAPAVANSHNDEPHGLLVQLAAPPAQVVKAVQQVTQDQIIHGTYSYEKERILYGAHSADAAHVFGVWKGPGKAYYKVANKVLSPRFFKDTEDIGTVSIRYVVQEVTANATTVQIDAVFVDARGVKHPSLGNVESSEYAAIQQHLQTIQDSQRQAVEAKAAGAAGSTAPMLSSLDASPATPSAPGPDSSVAGLTVPELQKRVNSLRHAVELRVKESGAPLKSAPYQGAATLEPLPGAAEVVVEILTPYWYGVETEDGHRGWVYHSQLEPLP